MPTIAVDFDDVISNRPQGWLKVMNSMKQIGFEVIVVTYRQPNMDPVDLQFLIHEGYEVIFTGQKAKRPFVKALGHKVDVWVDDTPESILFDYLPSNGKFCLSSKHDFKLDTKC